MYIYIYIMFGAQEFPGVPICAKSFRSCVSGHSITEKEMRVVAQHIYDFFCDKGGVSCCKKKKGNMR